MIFASQALRVVRSLDEIKAELRSLTVKVDGREETVAGLLETGRWFFKIWNIIVDQCKEQTISYLTSVKNKPFTDLCRLFVADYSSLATLPLIPGRVFYAPQVRQQALCMQPEPSPIHSFFLRCFWPGLQEETWNSWQSSSPPHTQPPNW